MQCSLLLLLLLLISPSLSVCVSADVRSAGGVIRKMEGSVVFVATQSDVLQPHEIRRALKLRADASVQECAAARNKFTSQRVASDFLDGLVEMATAAGDTVDRDEYERKFKLPVFTVSSMDYQKVRERCV